MNTLNSNTSPLTSTIRSPSFQSNCSWRPGGVSKRGCGSGSDGAAHSMPRVRQYWVKALYPGIPASGYLSSRNSWIAFFVTPGSEAFSSMTSLKPSKPLALSRLRSSISPPLFQYLATVCLLSPYLRPISVKLGFTPSWRYMFSSPMTFLSNRRSFQPVLLAETSIFTVVQPAEVRWCDRLKSGGAIGSMPWRKWLFLE